MAERHRTTRKGTILIVAMWIVVILSSLLLVFARSMRVEAISSGNRACSTQADAIERGAEQYILSLVDGTDGDPSAFTEIMAGNLPVGDGYFYLLKPDPDDNQQYGFGLTDEPSKLSLNYASIDELVKLPGITEDIADSIADWRDDDDNPTDQGAESDYYQSLPEPYLCKNGLFETVEELMLVKGMQPLVNGPSTLQTNGVTDIMFGIDLNHNGVIEPREQAIGGAYNGSSDASRGIFPFVTVWGREYNKDASGNSRLNLNSASPEAIIQALSAGMSSSRAQDIASQSRSGRPFANVFDFAQKTGMTPQELSSVYDGLTCVSSKTLNGLTNVITAPREVLMCLPTLEEGDADAMIGARTSAAPGDISWVADALPPEKCAAIGSRITGKSFQFSADIVAVSGDGRAFKRVRVVFDARKSPARIVYRKDMTDLGWPLSDDIRNDLRNGVAPLQGQTIQSGQSFFGSTGTR